MSNASPATLPALAAVRPALAAALLTLAAVLLTLAAAATLTHASAQSAAEWDITEPRGETREIAFTTTEGTWMSVDVSPDGEWLVFDLLGHIYRMPAGGGEAASITQNSALALNIHPVFSPDGSEIAFISDREGQNNLWIMNADGSGPRPGFTNINIRAMEPVWTPDGEYIVVRQTDMTGGGLFSYGLFMYHRDGGTGIELVPYTTEMPGWPSVSPDGRFLYFHQFVGSILSYGGQDSSKGDFQIRRLELATGEVTRVTSGQSMQQGRMTSGGAFAPELSPDGRFLAFGRRIPDGLLEYRGHVFGPRTGLWLRDLEDGTERLIMDPVEWDMSQEITRAAPILPRFTWSADGSRIYLSQGGGIRVLDPGSGSVETVPFTAGVQRTISEMAYATRSIPEGTFDARFLRWPTGSRRRPAYRLRGRGEAVDPGRVGRRTAPGHTRFVRGLRIRAGLVAGRGRDRLHHVRLGRGRACVADFGRWRRTDARLGPSRRVHEPGVEPGRQPNPGGAERGGHGARPHAGGQSVARAGALSGGRGCGGPGGSGRRHSHRESPPPDGGNGPAGKLGRRRARLFRERRHPRFRHRRRRGPP